MEIPVEGAILEKASGESPIRAKKWSRGCAFLALAFAALAPSAKAQQTAASSPSATEKAQKRSEALQILQQAGEVLGAEKSPAARYGVLFLWEDIAKARARAGDVDAALDAVKHASEEAGSGGLLPGPLGDITEIFAQAGQFALAFRVVAAIPGYFDRLDALLTIAQYQARSGDIAAARNTIALISQTAAPAQQTQRMQFMRKTDEDRALRYVARAQARAGDIKGALHTAAGVQGRFLGDTLCGIAEAQASRGDRAGAEETLKQAAPILLRARNPLMQLGATIMLLQAQARVGDFDAAFQTAKRESKLEGMDEGTCLGAGLAEIALEQFRAGDAEGGLKTVHAVPSLCEKRAALEHIGAWQLKTGDRAAAARTFQTELQFILARPKSEWSPNEISHIAFIALDQANAGDTAGASATIRHATELATDPSLPLWIRCASIEQVAFVQAKLGNTKAALSLASQMPAEYGWGTTSEYESDILMAVVKEQAGTKQFAAALATVADVKCPSTRTAQRDCALFRTDARQQIARAWAGAGNTKAALALAAEQNAPQAKAKILLGAAQGLLDSVQEPSRAGK